MRALPIAGVLAMLATVGGGTSSPHQSTPSRGDGGRLLLIRSSQLEQAARAPQNALTQLRADADRALTLKPMSVMDKTIAPPSGDKHDYMSQAPYWWPDPQKSDGKPYIRKDGQRNPEINRLPDHDNLGRLTSAVATLGLAYSLHHKPEYAEHAARLTRTWFLDPATRMHPHLKFGQGIPGINDGRGIGIIETRGLPGPARRHHPDLVGRGMDEGGRGRAAGMDA